MAMIYPSAAVLRQKYALVSILRAQGFAIGSFETAKPGPADLFLVADGETPPSASRTLIIAEADECSVVPFRDGNPARLAFPAEESAIGYGYASALLRGADAPVPQAELDAAWPEAAQRARCLFSLLEDGLAEQDDDGLFRLPA